jgi:hypothetical protein
MGVFVISLTGFSGPNHADILFCNNGGRECIGTVTVGDTITIKPPVPYNIHAWDFLNRLIEGNPSQTNSGSTTVGISTFDDPVSVAGILSVQAYGVSPAPVPIPAAIFLFAPGLGAVVMLRRKLSIKG